MYVVAGATGRVGSATARRLLAAGAPVRTLVRSRAAADHWTGLGAEADIVTLQDRAGLATALRGCRGLFAMLPFDLAADDPDARADEIIAAVAGAVTDQGVPQVVLLSSGGADLATGTGPIAGLHRFEQALLATGTTLTALRSQHFQEKVADVVEIARQAGIYPVFAGSADTPHPMAATADLGALAAAALQSPPPASETVDVVGPAYAEREVARLLGDALGRDLQVVPLPRHSWVDALTDAGFRPHVAASLAELYAADEQGLLAPRGDRQVRVATPLTTTLAGVVAG